MILQRTFTSNQELGGSSSWAIKTYGAGFPISNKRWIGDSDTKKITSNGQSRIIRSENWICIASFNIQSFMSKASFQETARVLAKAALRTCLGKIWKWYLYSHFFQLIYRLWFHVSVKSCIGWDISIFFYKQSKTKNLVNLFTWPRNKEVWPFFMSLVLLHRQERKEDFHLEV